MIRAMVGVLAVWLVLPGMAQSATRLGAGCDLAVLGAGDSSAFLRFDQALRAAVAGGQADAVAALAAFPLRLNLGDGHPVELANAAALRERAASVLPPLRKAVEATPPDALFCNGDGVMYGDGEVWANPQGDGSAAPFRISAINLPGPPPATAPAAPQLACSTAKFHIEITAATDGKPRYRSWNLPHGAPAKPAMELLGSVAREGSGACGHRVWRFRNGNVDYLVSEPGCSGEAVPAQAKARLEVTIDGKSRLREWCS